MSNSTWKKNYILLDHTPCSHREGSKTEVHTRQDISEKAMTSYTLAFADRT